MAEPPDQSEPRRRRFYGWRLVWAGAFIIALGGSLSSIVTQPGEGQSAVMMAVAPLLMVLLTPFIGWAVDRWGSRPVVLWTLAGLGGGFILLLGAQVTAVYYLAVSLLSLSGSDFFRIPLTAAVNNWFRRRRATAMAVLLMPSVLAPILMLLLQVGAGLLSVVNRPAGLLAVAVAIMAVAWPLSRLVRNRPEDYGQDPDGISSSDSNIAAPDYTWREALRSRAFWLITMGNAGSVSALGSMLMLTPPLMVERGLSTEQAALVIALQSIVSIPFMLAGGVLGDRIPIRWAIFAFSFLQFIAIGIVLFADTLPMFILFAIVMSIGSGGTPPLTSAIRGAYFGRRNFGTITGISTIPAAIMTLGMPAYMGFMYDATDAFTLPLVTIAAVSAVGSLLYLFLGNLRLSPSQQR